MDRPTAHWYSSVALARNGKVVHEVDSKVGGLPANYDNYC